MGPLDLTKVAPLLRCENGTYVVDESTLLWMSNIRKKICVIACAGKYRTGKSFLLNCLCGTDRASGFAVSDTVQTCTRGIWLYRQPLAEFDDRIVLVLDTEGIDALEQDTNDVRLFTLALLLSSTFLYNSVGPIDEAALQTLGLMTKISEYVKVTANETPTAAQLSAHMPHFYWLLRDFSLRMTRDDEPCTADEYLEGAIAGGGHSEERGRVRQTIRDAFPRRNLVTLPRPAAAATQNMQPHQVDGRFRKELATLRKRLVAEATPLSVNGAAVSGATYAELCRQFVACINRPDAVPVIRDTWSLLADVQARDALDEISRVAERDINTARKSTRCAIALGHALCALKTRLLAKFEEDLMESPSPDVRRKFEDVIARHADAALRDCEQAAAAELDAAIAQISARLREGGIATSRELADALAAADESSVRGGGAPLQERAWRPCIEEWLPAVHAFEEARGVAAIDATAAAEEKAVNAAQELGLELSLRTRHIKLAVDEAEATWHDARIALEMGAMRGEIDLQHARARAEAAEQQVRTLQTWEARNAGDTEGEEEKERSWDEEEQEERDGNEGDEKEKDSASSERLVEAEAMLRAQQEENAELRAIRGTLVAENGANRIACEELEVACNERLQELQERHSSVAARWRTEASETIQRVRVELRVAQECEADARARAKESQAQLSVIAATLFEKEERFRCELRAMKEAQLTARASCEDLQMRMMQMHTISLADMRQRDDQQHDRHSLLVSAQLNAHIERGEAMRLLERAESDRSDLKRRLGVNDTCMREEKRAKLQCTQLRDDTVRLRSRCEDVVTEREALLSKLMQCERRNATLGQELSLTKAENTMQGQVGECGM